MVLAAYLIEFEGYNIKDAVDKVIAVRPIAFSAEGWMEFAREVLELYKTHNQAMQFAPTVPDRRTAGR